MPSSGPPKAPRQRSSARRARARAFWRSQGPVQACRLQCPAPTGQPSPAAALGVCKMKPPGTLLFPRGQHAARMGGVRCTEHTWVARVVDDVRRLREGLASPGVRSDRAARQHLPEGRRAGRAQAHEAGRDAVVSAEARRRPREREVGVRGRRAAHEEAGRVRDERVRVGRAQRVFEQPALAVAVVHPHRRVAGRASGRRWPEALPRLPRVVDRRLGPERLHRRPARWCCPPLERTDRPRILRRSCEVLGRAVSQAQKLVGSLRAPARPAQVGPRHVQQLRRGHAAHGVVPHVR